jgi:3-keto-5-aminohexanoate cleavage enzyme
VTRSQDHPLIITAAICGGVHGREANSHLPMTPEEIAASIRAARAAGAAIAHVHVWDEDGRPSPDPAYYREVYEQLDCDIVVNLTTGPGGTPTPDERLLALSLRPELASFDAGSLNFGDDVFVNDMPFLRRLAAEMREAGTRPELEIFDEGMIGNCLLLRDEGLLEEPLYFQFVLGVPGGAPARARTLLHLVESIPEESPWSVTGIGRGSVPMALHALALGGHVRVGLEDTVFFSAGRLATSNAELVERVAALARVAGREIATPDQARELLALRRVRSELGPCVL